MSTESRTLVCKRLARLGLTSAERHQILREIDHLKQHHGVAWLVARLKALKTLFVNSVAGIQQDDHMWIAWRGLAPKGAFRRIYMRGVNNPKERQRSLSALMVYTAYTYAPGHISKAQFQKWISAVEEPYRFDESLFSKPGISHVYRSLDKLSKKLAVAYLITSPDYPAQWLLRQKEAPDILQTGVKDTFLSAKLQETLYDIFEAHTLAQNSLAFVEGWTRIKKRTQRWAVATSAWVDVLRQPHEWRKGRGLVGLVTVNQEPGLKARIVANVHPGYQLAVSHIANAIYKVLGTLPQDSRMDQAKGVTSIQQWLRDNPLGKLASIDLSSATDRAPWAPQRYLLDKAGEELQKILEIEGLPSRVTESILACYRREVEAVTDIVEGEYLFKAKLYTKDGIKALSTTVHWSCGQEMGAIFSFGLFSLFHHALVRSSQPAFYRILGDDLVIDMHAAPAHAGKLDAFGMDWSLEKSLYGSDHAEFAGKLISANKVYSQSKVKETNDSSFVEQARVLGPRSYRWFDPLQREVLGLLDVVLPSIYPLGLGFNSKGLKYEDRVLISEYLRARYPTVVPPRNSYDSRSLAVKMHQRAIWKRPRLHRHADELAPQGLVNQDALTGTETFYGVGDEVRKRKAFDKLCAQRVRELISLLGNTPSKGSVASLPTTILADARIALAGITASAYYGDLPSPISGGVCKVNLENPGPASHASEPKLKR